MLTCSLVYACLKVTLYTQMQAVFRELYTSLLHEQSNDAWLCYQQPLLQVSLQYALLELLLVTSDVSYKCLEGSVDDWVNHLSEDN